MGARADRVHAELREARLRVALRLARIAEEQRRPGPPLPGTAWLALAAAGLVVVACALLRRREAV